MKSIRAPLWYYKSIYYHIYFIIENPGFCSEPQFIFSLARTGKVWVFSVFKIKINAQKHFSKTGFLLPWPKLGSMNPVFA